MTEIGINANCKGGPLDGLSFFLEGPRDHAIRGLRIDVTLGLGNPREGDETRHRYRLVPGESTNELRYSGELS